MVELAIALGILLGLIGRELIGFSAAGLVVPGYLAVCLNQPLRLASTLALALATWATVRFGLARLVILYGRRRQAVAVLVGFLINALFEEGMRLLPAQPLDLRAIGYIVPGLLASEALAQGIVPTFAMTLLVAALVRIVLVFILRVAG